MVRDSSSCPDIDCDHHRWCSDIVLRISDCNRVVSPDFDLDTPAARRNALTYEPAVECGRYWARFDRRFGLGLRATGGASSSSCAGRRRWR